MTRPDIEREARALAEREGLAAVFLFGSWARGRQRPDSDVDLALLGTAALDPLALFDWAAGLESILGRPVDLVDLRSASPILARQVLRHGSCVVRKDPRSVQEFIARTLTDYEDLKRARAPVERALLGSRRG